MKRVAVMGLPELGWLLDQHPELEVQSFALGTPLRTVMQESLRGAQPGQVAFVACDDGSPEVGELVTTAGRIGYPIVIVGTVGGDPADRFPGLPSVTAPFTANRVLAALAYVLETSLDPLADGEEPMAPGDLAPEPAAPVVPSWVSAPQQPVPTSQREESSAPAWASGATAPRPAPAARQPDPAFEMPSPPAGVPPWEAPRSSGPAPEPEPVRPPWEMTSPPPEAPPAPAAQPWDSPTPTANGAHAMPWDAPSQPPVAEPEPVRPPWESPPVQAAPPASTQPWDAPTPPPVPRSQPPEPEPVRMPWETTGPPSEAPPASAPPWDPPAPTTNGAHAMPWDTPPQPPVPMPQELEPEPVRPPWEMASPPPEALPAPAAPPWDAPAPAANGAHAMPWEQAPAAPPPDDRVWNPPPPPERDPITAWQQGTEVEPSPSHQVTPTGSSRPPWDVPEQHPGPVGQTPSDAPWDVAAPPVNPPSPPVRAPWESAPGPAASSSGQEHEGYQRGSFSAFATTDGENAFSSLSQPPPERATGHAGRVVAVVSATGGVGKTTLALWTTTAIGAAVVRRQGRGVVLVDANVEQADVAKRLRMWGRVPDLSVYAHSGKTEGDLNRCLTDVPELGAKILAGPTDPMSLRPHEASAALHAAIRTLRRTVDWIVVDCPTGSVWDPFYRDVVLAEADLLLVVVPPSLPALHSTDMWLKGVCSPVASGGAAYQPDRVGLVLNRHERDVGVDVDEVRHKLLQRWRLLGEIPDVLDVRRDANAGRPVSPAEAAPVVGEVVALLTGEHVPVAGRSLVPQGKPTKARGKQLALSAGDGASPGGFKEKFLGWLKS